MDKRDPVRKYITEWTLLITISGRYLGRQQELAALKAAVLAPCHLYLVTTRPRMSIHPRSVEFHTGRVTGLLRLQRGEQYEEYPFDVPHSFKCKTPEWVSDWPYEEFSVVSEDGETLSGGVVGLLSAWFPRWPEEASRHHVVYVGQAFGQAGERTAWDRLMKHETVQKVLAETSPDKQVWLILADISDEQLMIDMDPTKTTLTSSTEDDEHNEQILAAVNGEEFKYKEAIALAEAGLIRYLQPKYNDRMKYNFPARKQVPLEVARRLDLHGLIVELQGEAVDATFGSDVITHNWIHFAGFEVHNDEGRAGTVSLSAADLPPGLGFRA